MKEKIARFVFELSEDGSFYTLVNGDAFNATTLAIPSLYNGLLVKKISDDAFSMKKRGNPYYNRLQKVSKIIIPSSIEYIGKRAFSDKYNYIETIEFENGSRLSEIDDFAFAKCNFVTKIKFPESIIRIGKSSFESCKLKEVLFEDHVENEQMIDDNDKFYPFADFFNETNINETVEIQKSKLEVIDEKAFRGCKMDKIIIPDSVKFIGDGAFSDNTRTYLKQVEISKNSIMISIGANNFKPWGDKEDFTIFIPKNVSEIGYNNFDLQRSKVIVDKDNAIFSIDKYGALLNKKESKIVFIPFKTLSNYRMPTWIQKIDDYLFQDVTKWDYHLKTSISKNIQFVIPKNVKKIGDYCFQECKVFESIIFEENSELEILGEYSFDHIKVEEEIIFPKNLKIIKDRAFTMHQHEEFHFESVDNIEESYVVTETMKVIPPKIKIIKKCELKQDIILIPKSVEIIEKDVFAYSKASKIIFDPMCNIQSIAQHSFFSCSPRIVILPESIEYIDKEAFNALNPNLEMDIYMRTKKPSLKWHKDWSETPEFLTHEFNYDIGRYCSEHGGRKLNVYYKDDWHHNEQHDLYYKIIDSQISIIFYLGNNTHIILPSEIDGLPITTIGAYSFAGLKTIISVKIPKSVINISDFAFKNCESLTDIKISKSVKHIGSSAFYGCSLLTVSAEPKQQPRGWDLRWNRLHIYQGSWEKFVPVVWNYTK